jgi:hypothetical protein
MVMLALYLVKYRGSKSYREAGVHYYAQHYAWVSIQLYAMASELPVRPKDRSGRYGVENVYSSSKTNLEFSHVQLVT